MILLAFLLKWKMKVTWRSMLSFFLFFVVEAEFGSLDRHMLSLSFNCNVGFKKSIDETELIFTGKIHKNPWFLFIQSNSLLCFFMYNFNVTINRRSFNFNPGKSRVIWRQFFWLTLIERLDFSCFVIHALSWGLSCSSTSSFPSSILSAPSCQTPALQCTMCCTKSICALCMLSQLYISICACAGFHRIVWNYTDINPVNGKRQHKHFKVNKCEHHVLYLLHTSLILLLLLLPSRLPWNLRHVLRAPALSEISITAGAAETTAGLILIAALRLHHWSCARRRGFYLAVEASRLISTQIGELGCAWSRVGRETRGL